MRDTSVGSAGKAGRRAGAHILVEHIREEVVPAALYDDQLLIDLDKVGLAVTAYPYSNLPLSLASQTAVRSLSLSPGEGGEGTSTYLQPRAPSKGNPPTPRAPPLHATPTGPRPISETRPWRLALISCIVRCRYNHK